MTSKIVNSYPYHRIINKKTVLILLFVENACKTKIYMNFQYCSERVLI